jgi:hypothetical protein
MNGMPWAKDYEKELLKDRTNRDMVTSNIAAQRKCFGEI